MRSDTQTSRLSGVGATTTTLVALVAMATTCSAAVLPKHAHGQHDCRLLLIEGQSVRHVAAAVAAIARDLFAGDHTEAVVPESSCTDQYLPVVDGRQAIAGSLKPIAAPLLEHHLDLPPPAC